MNLLRIIKVSAVMAVMLLYTWRLSAVPVYPGPIKVVQPDGTELTVLSYGDERFSYSTTTDGYNLIGVRGVMYYANQQNGRLVSTGVLAHNPGNRSAEERHLLHTLTYGRPYAAEATIRAASIGSGIAFGASPKKITSASNCSAISSGEEFRSLVILVEFEDRRFSIENPQMEFDRLLNEDGYSDNGATGSAHDYYFQNSNGQFDPHFDVVGPYLMEGTSVYDYGTGSSNPNSSIEFVTKACNLAEANGVDFSPYINDDGTLRDVFIFYAGYNNAEAPGGYIHPARLYMLYGIPIGEWGGGLLMAAAYTSELKGAAGTTMAGIGTFCHEFGHILGWPDFYDSDYDQNGTGFSLDVFSLMASGSYVNEGRTPPALSAYERYMAGWMELQELSEAGEYELKPVYDNNGYVVKTANEGEVFVLEYRNGTINTWDRFLVTGNNGTSFPASGPGSGMLVYHVDRSRNNVHGHTAESLWDNNEVNAYGDHECMRIVMASSIARENGRLVNFGKMFFPGTDNVTELTATASPYFLDWNGMMTGLELYNIVENGTENVSFEVKKMEAGTISHFTVTPYQFDVVVSFVAPLSDSYRIECVSADGEKYSVTTTDRTIDFTGLTPGTEYTIYVYGADGDEPIETAAVSTAALDTSKVPALNLNYNYNVGDTVVLTFSNVHDNINSVRWTVNGTEVKDTVLKLSAGNGYEVMAEITTDAGTEYLMRYINVK